MKNQSAGSLANAHFAWFRHSVLALCAVALATLLPHSSVAQQITYYDFNGPAAAPSQSSTACLPSSAPSGVLFCLNAAAGSAGLSFVQDSYPPSIDPNASSDGDSGSTNYALQLTEAAESQVSSVWYATPQNVANGFNLWYAVKLNYQYAPPNYFTGDGLAFVIQNAAGGATDTITNSPETGSGLTVLGNGGGALGYGGIDNSVALEMDTFWDAPFDPDDGVTYFPDNQFDDNHIALQSCGAGNANSPAHLGSPNCLITLTNGPSTLVSNPNTSAAPPATASPVILADGNPHQIVMIYNGPNDSPANYLYVYLDPALNPGTHTPVTGSAPLFSGQFDITNYINLNNGTAYIGFTAANGGDFEQHELMGFSFTPHGFSSVNVCPSGQISPAPCSSTLPVTFNIPADTTVSSVQVVTQGATGLDFQEAVAGDNCTGTFSTAGSCTVNVTFAPIAPGLRMGAVNLVNGGTIVASHFISGVGQAPEAVFSPLTSFVESTGPYTLSAPKGVAVDAAGDIFVSNFGSGQVVEIGAHGTFQTVGTGLSEPQGLAVDGAGDLFIADNGLNEVVEVPAGCTLQTCQIPVGSGLSSQLGVAVDGAGDVFIGDFNGHDVVEVPVNGGPQTVVYSPAGTSSNPVGLAVDAAGDLFVADFGLREVVEVPAGCTSSGCYTTVGVAGEWSAVEGVSVDAAGDVFVSDAGLRAVVEVPAGCISVSCQITVAGTSQVSLGGGFEPYDAVVDGQGNIYIADLGLNRVDAILQQFASLTFSQSAVDNVSGDSPQSVLFQNIGNQALNATSPGLVFTDPDFYQFAGSGTPTDCSTTFSLEPGAACNLSVDFDPLSSGPLSGSAQFTDNALNATPGAAQAVKFSGSGLTTNYALSVNTAGSGSGILSGTNCSTGSYSPGTAVVCTETPAAGSQFTGWSGGTCSGTGSCSFSLSANSTVVANFALAYALTVTEIGSGSGTVTSLDTSISCTTGSTNGCSSSYLSGAPVTLTAAATGTSAFLGWGGACAASGMSATCNITMNSALGVTVSFVQQSFGNVNVCPSGQTSPAPCSGALTLTYNLAATTTFGATQVVTQGAGGLDFSLANGSTCTGTKTAGNSCIVNVNFAPLAPGLRTGAVRLYDNLGNLVASTPIYGIGEAPEIAFGPGTQTTVAGGLDAPRQIALDGAGDIFLAQNLSNQVVKIPVGGGTPSSVGSGLSGPYGVALDGAGDIYIADTGHNQVVEVPVGCTSAACQTTVASGLNFPLGVAVDGQGNLFIADTNNNQVLELPAGGGPRTTVASGLNNPNTVVVDSAGDLFIVYSNSQLVKIPAGCASSACWTTVATGLSNPRGAAVDAGGDVFIGDTFNSRVVEVPAGCTSAGCQTTVGSGFGYPWGVAVDNAGDVFITDTNDGQLAEVNRSQLPSLSFALTNQGSTSTDSPQAISLQNVGNQTLTGSVTPTSTASFLENMSSSCGSFSLAPGATCSESFSFTPQTTGYLTDAAFFSDNTLNLTASVVAQQVGLSGVGDLAGQTATITVPNLVGMTQSAATSALTGAGLALGSVSSEYSSGEPAGSVIGENPAAGTQVNAGSAVKVLLSIGEAPPPSPNPLTFENNYFVTGDYAAAGVSLRGAPVANGLATGTIAIPNGTSNGVPTGADIIDAFLYWTTLENTATASGGSGTFLGYSIAGQQIGSDLPNYTDGAFTGTLRAYRADVNTYLPIGANGIRLGSGSFNVALPAGTNALPLTEGASLVIIYRALVPPKSMSPSPLPLKSVVIYDGLASPAASTTQNIQGFYDAVGGASGTGESTALFYAGGNWSNSSASVGLGSGSQYNAPLAQGNVYVAEILSTPVNNSDNDGILDSWKSGPGAGDFFQGQPGYYDVKTQSWVPLPGAKHGEQDLFVQMDWMCGAVDSNGNCSGEDLYPSPDSDGNDPLAIVQQSFLNIGVHLHLAIGNAVPETTCNDATSPQLCQFPGQPGVIGWKNSLEFSKLWPRNFDSCAAGGDCTARFPFGQKDSYHYVLFGHSLAIPAWNSRYASLMSITVSGPVTTIVTTDRGSGINACPSRITISGVLGNPGLNGVYNTTGCADTKTMTIATPTGVPNWSYPNSTLAEPVIGITSGTVTSISGYSDLGGADSAVTLALWETAPNQDMSKRANVIAGTLFHEIGHTLGLTHGGLYYEAPGSYVPTFDVNCKPNYQSAMNYLFQLDGLGPNAAVAYSNQTLETLNDTTGLTGLTQLTDINNLAPTFPTSAWYSPTAPSSTASAATLHCDGTPLTGDTGYRIDGSVSPITPAWTNGQNITFDGVPYSQLLGYNDVSNIDLRQVGATGGEFASLAGILSFGNSATPLTVQAGGNVSLGSGGTVALGSGGTVTLGSGGNVTLGSGGTITPGSNGSVTLNNGGSATLSTGGTITVGNSGGTVTLGSGGVIALGSGATIGYGNSGGNVTLGSGGNVTLGSGGTIALGGGISVTIPSTGGAYTIGSNGGTITLGSGGTVALGSGGNVTLGSGGTIALGSGGNVTLGSGGNVTLGSGGTIALGSGGTVALGSGGNVTLGSGGTVALGSGGNVTLGSGGNVTLGSGGLVTLGSGGDLSVGAGGNVTLGSGGTVTLGSGGNVTLGSGGNVTLGSGGTIALGSGGTIALGSGGNVTLGSGGLVTLGSGGTITSSNGVAVIAAGGSYTLPAGGGTIALGSGGNITLGSGGNVTLGSGGNVTLGSGGTITMGGGGTVTLNGGGNVTLGSGGVVALGSGGNVTLGSGGTIALGSGGNVTLGSGGVTSTEMNYDTANSIVRPPPLASETPTPIGVRVNWIPPVFGVVNTYTILRSSDGAPPIVVGSVSGGGVNGFAPATAFTDTNPDTTSQTVVYTITTTLVPDAGTSTQRSSLPSPPAVQTNDQTIVLGTVPTSVALPGPVTVTATAETNGVANGLQVSFSVTGNCSIGGQSIASGVSSASVTLNSTGSCTVTASQPGTSLSQTGNLLNYNAATPVSATFAIQAQGSNLQSQTINFPILPNIQYGSTFPLAASSTSGEAVTFSASGPCGINGKTTGIGVCTITASAATNSTYNGASLSQSFNIYPAVITVTATNLTGTYGQTLPALTYTLSPTVNGDPSTVITGTPALSTTATSTSNAGPYTIAVSTGSLAAQNYSFQFAPSTLTIQPAGQAINFSMSAPATAAFNSSFTVAASASSGLAVTFTSAGSCSNSGATYTMNNSTGTCSVIANQAGNGNYSKAPTVTQTVNASGPSVTVSPSNLSFGKVTLGSISTQNITVTDIGTAPVTINQPVLSVVQGGNSNEFVAVNLCPTPLAVGKSCTITIAFVAGPYYTPQTATLEIMDNAPGSPQPVTLSATVLMPQTITFTTNPPSSAVYNSSFTVAASASSGLAVSYTSAGSCSNSGAKYTMISGTGSCSVIANQAGNSTYAPASQVTKTVAATAIAQTIAFVNNPPASVAYNTSFTVSATASSSLPVTFTSSGSCSNSGATYTMTSSKGNCSVIANQAGNANYSAAAQITKTVSATVATQAITFTVNAPSSAAYKSSFTVAASASSGLAVSFTSAGSCSNSGAIYTMTSGTGSCTVKANQAGNTNYSAALQVTETVTATLATQAITFTTNAPSSAVYKSSFTVAATGGGSGNPITYTSSGACSNSGAKYTMTSGTGTCSVIANQAGTTNDYSAAPQVTETVSAAYAVATLSPASLSFGTVSSGKSSAAQTATLTNTGTVPLIIGSIGFTGTNPGNFSQTNNCPSSSSSLAAGAKCTISVTFNSGGKAVTANLAVADNTQVGTQTVSLSGN